MAAGIGPRGRQEKEERLKSVQWFAREIRLPLINGTDFSGDFNTI